MVGTPQLDAFQQNSLNVLETVHHGTTSPDVPTVPNLISAAFGIVGEVLLFVLTCNADIQKIQ